jgi:N-acetylneuraminic acid mutarotase
MRLALLLVALTACTASPSAATPTPVPPASTAAAVPTPTSGTTVATGWQRIADIPTPRSEVAAAVYQGDKVYVVGGFGGRDRVERYDAAARRWDRVADLPHGVDHPMAAAVFGIQTSGDTGVYVFGGYAGGATARSFRLDVASGRWSEIAPMPAPRAAGAAVAINTRIYVVGGADGSRLISPTYVYDVTTRAWSTVAAIPTPRDHLGAVELAGRVCAVAGRRLSMSANLGTLECYDPRTDRWEKLADAPTPRGGVGAAAYGQQIYLIGGEQPSGTF